LFESRLLKKVFERKREEKSDMAGEKFINTNFMNSTHQIIRGCAYRFHRQLDA